MIPAIPLNGGTTIPQLGFGTLRLPPVETAQIVGQALDVGYRHIDTAQMYGTEEGVGTAIVTSGIPRDDLYITTKLANSNHHRDDVRRSFEESLRNLRIEQLDLFLMHWPLPTLYDGDYVSTWTAITELLADGRLRAVGVSNFQPAHLDRIINETGVVPAVNQIESHPYFHNDVARAASQRHGIAVEAWSPLGQGKVLTDRVIGQIAQSLGRPTSQIILRWHIQRGDITIPRTVHRARMEENLNIFDFELTPEQIATIDALDEGPDGRIGPNPDTFDWAGSGSPPASELRR
jgi:2,5-diketo-D-gluconate reductase A